MGRNLQAATYQPYYYTWVKHWDLGWGEERRWAPCSAQNRAILGIDKMDYSSLYADWGQIRGLERMLHASGSLLREFFISRH